MKSLQRMVITRQESRARSAFRCGWLLVPDACLIVAVVICGLQSVSAQVLTVPEMVEQKSQWQAWADDGTKLKIKGRFEGRAGTSFRMQKLRITFDPPRSLQLPDRMQAGQRVEVSGRLRGDNGGFHFNLLRLVVTETDSSRLEVRAARIPSDQPTRLLDLATEYDPIAEFYDDNDLKERIASVRRRGFRQMRALSGNDSGKLWKLIETGKQLGIVKKDIDAVLFESLVVQWRDPSHDPVALAKLIQKHLPEWDRVENLENTQIPVRFLADPNAVYDVAGSSARKVMHRHLFRLVQHQVVQNRLKADGSNGISLAAEIRNTLPEEEATAVDMEEREIAFRLARVDDLNRLELQQLADLLARYERGGEIAAATDSWLKHQELRFSRIGLSGKIRTADEYQFVGERWRRPEHIDKAINLLKEAWQLAAEQSPGDAQQIADRLRAFGWQRMHDRWMTSKQVSVLPRDDIELAIREGRIVKGMTTEQVVQTLGRPASVSRIISASAVQELWSYGGQIGGGLVIRMRRTPSAGADGSRVVSVSGTSR
jgi:hypothetical protein